MRGSASTTAAALVVDSCVGPEIVTDGFAGVAVFPTGGGGALCNAGRSTEKL